MIEVLADPALWVLVGYGVVVAVVVAFIRHEPWYDVAVRVVGFSAFLVGIRWVGDVEPDLAPAVMLAAGGFGLVTWSPKLPIARRTRPGQGPTG